MSHPFSNKFLLPKHIKTSEGDSLFSEKWERKERLIEAIKATKKRRIIHINTDSNLRKIKYPTPCSFQEHLGQMSKDWQALIHKPQLASDARFLRRMAINIKHLHYDAKKKQKEGALRIAHFLSTPLGAPFVTKETLLKAAYLFSEQDPKESDLCMILKEFATYGVRYPMHLLSPFS
jgi:hypothetical protein